MSSKVTLSLVAPFVCALAAAQNASAQAYSSDDLVRIAIERNRELQATQQRVAEASGLLRQAGIRPAPSLQFEGSTGRPLGSSGEEEYATGYSHPLEMGENATNVSALLREASHWPKRNSASALASW
ncbi:MAG TPA: hypothetical protein PKJ41_01075 [Bryobacteraceae bacterium]|nr:hypothetical protein [Bryobacteraceae bacterium]HPT25252.1 hypothetical protein [Bryobacteraceae bacterium]